jgi:hypothetical protein
VEADGAVEADGVVGVEALGAVEEPWYTRKSPETPERSR